MLVSTELKPLRRLHREVSIPHRDLCWFQLPGAAAICVAAMDMFQSLIGIYVGFNCWLLRPL